MRNIIGYLILGIAFLALGSTKTTAQGTKKKPNIIFILTDDLGYHDLGTYGNPYNKTPHLDALAKQGMKFTQAYVASPICSASRAALLTGKHPARLHLTNYLVGLRTDSLSPVLPAPYKHHLPSKEVTLAQMITQQGYSSGIVGKWHLGSGDSISPIKRGFNYERLIGKNGLDYYNYSITSEGKTVFEDHGKDYLTDKLTDYGVEFIEENKEKPFFLYLAYSAPHVFIVPKGEKLKNYFMNYNKYDGKYNPYYGAMLESLDEGVGRIVDKVKALGLDENTIIVFTSDNGSVGLNELGPIPASSDPFRAWKGHVYEGGVRVPSIVSWTGKIPAGTVNDNYFTNLDYMPTLLEAIGADKKPTGIDGRSIFSTFLKPTERLTEIPLFFHYPHFSNQMGRPSGAVRLGDYKLVESYETGKTELYNLTQDISESKDVSKKYPAKSKQLYALLKNWQKEVNANMPIPNPNYKKK